MIFPHIWFWLEVHTGIAHGGPDPYYNFWSGIGSDLSELAILAGAITLVRHHNCHTKGCWRLGRKVDGTPYVACHHHHPFHKGNKRNVSVEEITKAATEAQTQP